MVEIVSDQQEVETSLLRVVDLIEQNGGQVSSDVRIICQGSQMWVEMDNLTEPNSPAITIPRECLLPIEDVKFGVSGPDFEIASVPSSYSTAQKKLLEEMIATYNACGKAALWRTSNIDLALENQQDVIKGLYSGRSINAKSQAKIAQFENGETPENLIASFLDSRLLLVGGNNPDGGTRNLMPLIDIYNHHISGARFSVKKDALRIGSSQPTAGSKEVFACYSFLDAQDCLHTYGFVDLQAPIMRSVPLIVALDGINEIKINSGITRKRKEKLPKQLADLKMLFPRINRTPEETLITSHLFIPSRSAPRSMRRILAVLIRNSGGLKKTRAIEPLILEAERQILNENQDYLDRLDAMLDGITPGEREENCFTEIRRLTQKQSRMIDEYRTLARF
jgi:hypothetical protein